MRVIFKLSGQELTFLLPVSEENGRIIEWGRRAGADDGIRSEWKLMELHFAKPMPCAGSDAGSQQQQPHPCSQPSAFDHIRRKWEALNPRKMD
jgi:hypothetical protein